STTIAPASVCRQGSYAETYSRSRKTYQNSSEARIPEVDLLGDACNPLGRPRDLVETVGDDRGPRRIDGAILNRADRAGRPFPAAGGIRLPVHRCEARRAARGRLELLGDPLQVHLGLPRIVGDHLEKTLPQRVLQLQTEEEM